MKLPICDITPFTLQDFPDHTACILWFGGCNMRCAYCHNPELVEGKKTRIPERKVLEFLYKRQTLLDGVVLSGGECTMSPALPDFIEKLKIYGYLVKLDTNGSNPNMLEYLLRDGLLDYVALDYKAPPDKLESLTDWAQIDLFQQSLTLLCNSNVPFEVRTTVHTSLLDEDDIQTIMMDLQQHGFKGNYFIQNFQPSPETMRPLPEQSRILNLSQISAPAEFLVHTRNF